MSSPLDNLCGPNKPLAPEAPDTAEFAGLKRSGLARLLQTHRLAIREIAARHRALNVRVFGSALHGDDTEDSDLDLLVEPTAETTLMDIAKIQVEVARLLHIGVDVLPPNALPEKFRAQVMAEAVAV